jgi:hypothetical protein
MVRIGRLSYVSADLHAVDQRVFQRNVVGKAFGQRHGRASWFVNPNVNGTESLGCLTSLEEALSGFSQVGGEHVFLLRRANHETA